MTLPSGTRIWQPELPNLTHSRKTGAVQACFFKDQTALLNKSNFC
ncbi:AMP nucleosidase [Klebsiella michiganensis]|nr:AMP nucleosidase [Klebsiella michiganensis]